MNDFRSTDNIISTFVCNVCNITYTYVYIYIYIIFVCMYVCMYVLYMHACMPACLQTITCLFACMCRYETYCLRNIVPPFSCILA